MLPTTRPLWPKNLQDKMVFKCLICSGLGARCDVCNETDPTKFSKSMVGNKSLSNRRTLCLDCTSPACTAPDCKTCKRCRNPACKRTNRCDKQPKRLNTSQYPKTMAEKISFRCSACQRTKCSLCQRAATKMQNQRHRKKNTTEPMTCGDCLTSAISREDLRKLQ